MALLKAKLYLKWHYNKLILPLSRNDLVARYLLHNTNNLQPTLSKHEYCRILSFLSISKTLKYSCGLTDPISFLKLFSNYNQLNCYRTNDSCRINRSDHLTIKKFKLYRYIIYIDFSFVEARSIHPSSFTPSYSTILLKYVVIKCQQINLNLCWTIILQYNPIELFWIKICMDT